MLSESITQMVSILVKVQSQSNVVAVCQWKDEQTSDSA